MKRHRLPHKGPIRAGHDAGAHEAGEDLEAQLFAIARVKDSLDFALPNISHANTFLWEQQTWPCRPSFCCSNPSSSPPSCLHSAFCPEKIKKQCISRQILNSTSACEWLQRLAATSHTGYKGLHQLLHNLSSQSHVSELLSLYSNGGSGTTADYLSSAIESKCYF